MRTASQKTKLALLLEYVDQWKARVGSREAVAVAIVETHIQLGLNNLPKLNFETTGDSFTLAKNAADRIFRWLDDKTKDSNFMPANFEDSILLAMPDDLRFSYMNDWLSKFNMKASSNIANDRPASISDGVKHIRSVSKECSEAVTAMADMLDGNLTIEEINSAEKELREAGESVTQALTFINAVRPEVK